MAGMTSPWTMAALCPHFKECILQPKVLIRHMLKKTNLTALMAVFLLSALWANEEPPQPGSLFAGGLNLFNVIYSDITWDENTETFTGATGTGDIYLFPLDAAKTSGKNELGAEADTIPLAFENLTIDVSGTGPGNVIAGEVRFVPSEEPLTFGLNGFQFTLETLVLDDTGAHGSGLLRLPGTVIAGGACGPAELALGHVAFHPAGGFYQVSEDGDYGPWRLAETGMVLGGTGFVADFTQDWKWSGWTGAGSPSQSWRGLILTDGQTLPPFAPPVSNTGYLQAPYEFSLGTVEDAGVTANLELAQPYAYNTLQPFGHVMELENGNLSLQANQITGGSFQEGQILLPIDAARSAAGQASAQYMQLDVQPGLDLFGEITIAQDLSWGEFVNGPDIKRYTVLGSGDAPLPGYYYLPARPFEKSFLPLDHLDIYDEPDLTLAPLDLMENQGIQGAFFYPGKVAILSEDLDREDPLVLGDAKQGSWCHVGAKGVSGTLFIRLDDDNIDVGNPANYDADVAFDTLFTGSNQDRLILFRFVDSALYQSDAKGMVTLPGPINASLEFENLRFTSTAQIVAADVDIPEAGMDLEYWGVGLAKEPGETHAGVMSVRAGMIMLTAAGITEEIHFDNPFWLIWGEVEPSGQMGNLSFDFSGYQKFDDFQFTTEAVALSEYVPALKGHLEVGGHIHYPYFGGGYLHIIDEDFDDETGPHFGHSIMLSNSANTPFKASELEVQGNWGNGTADLFYTLSYDTGDQSGFQGVGYVDHHKFNNNLDSSVNFESGGGCLSILQNQRRVFGLGPVTSFSAARNIAGCACIEGDLIKQFSLTGELETSHDDNVMLRSAAYGSLQLTWTPSTNHMNVVGDMFFSLLFGTDLQMTGNANFLVDRGAGFVDGHVNAKVSAAAIFTGLEANGEFEWHVGDFQALQGRVAVDVYKLSLFGYGGSGGVEGGFFAGIGVPKDEAWILSDADPEFKIQANLPDYLTGLYGYVEVSGSKSWSVLASAGFRLHAGLGAFVGESNNNAIQNLPFAMGNLGVEVWGKILGGLISARGWADLQILLPSFLGFHGMIGLEGCAGWLLCDQVDLEAGLNPIDGFYLR